MVAGTTFDTNLLSRIPIDVAIALPPPFFFHSLLHNDLEREAASSFFFSFIYTYTNSASFLFLIRFLFKNVVKHGRKSRRYHESIFIVLYHFSSPLFPFPCLSIFMMKACSALVLCA